MAKSLSFYRSMTPTNRLTAEELRAGASLVARFIATAYAVDHPESFGNERNGNLEEEARSHSLQPDLTPPRQKRTLQTSRDHRLRKQPVAPDHTA